MKQSLEAIKMVHAYTGMIETTSDRQRMNGTIAFRDEELFETYTIHAKTGYARRKNSWNGIYQLNDKEPYSYVSAYNGQTYEATRRILLKGDYVALAQLVIRGYGARRERAPVEIVLKRQYVWDIAARKRNNA